MKLQDEEDEEYVRPCWEGFIPVRLRGKLCSKRRPPRNRKVYLDNKVLPGDDPLEVFNYPDNRVISSKYTLFTFLPKNLFEQFRRIANFYFLCVALTQFLIDTPVTPITSVLPLLIVISISAIKQGYEDYLRHKADNDVNLRPTVIIRNGEVQKGCRAMDIRVGDIVKTYINEEFPCDMVLLSSEDSKGHCFITTANLDGETNLKTQYSQSETCKFRTPEAFGTLRASITCKPQTADLYTFQGVMHFGHDADPQSLGPEHILLRGARLKNTPWVYGCAIYTGKETKMALNSKPKSAKFSRIEKKLNIFLILFMGVLLMGMAVPTALKYWWEDKEGEDPWYFYDPDESDKNSPGDVIETALSFMVLINYIIPISLYVTIEMQKFFGSMFFSYDLQMYDEELDERAVANTSDLNEELGQVEYLFTDKTGTLTENNMTFRKCVIGKREFEEVDGMLCEKTDIRMIPITDPGFNVHSNDPERSSRKSWKFRSKERPPAEMTEFLRVLVLCHTVRVDRRTLKQQSMSHQDHDDKAQQNRNDNAPQHFLRWRLHKKDKKGSRDSLDSYYDQQEETVSNCSDTNNHSIHKQKRQSFYSETGQEYEYQAASPDEKAFVEACCKYGTIYHGMIDDTHEVTIQSEMQHFKLLETLPFDPTRKRMSVIIRDAEGQICLLCKGAEVAIFDRVVEGNIETTQKCIDDYARCGFRTLCLARRKLTEAEYQLYSQKLTDARLSLVDREMKVAEVYNELECNLTLLGATAVEDKLQQGVPETIQALRDAGIKVWVLTGDKEETAVNISHSAGHFNTTMNEIRLTGVSSLEQCRLQIRHLMDQVSESPSGTKFALVIDGKSLAYALRWHPHWLRELCSYCVAVLCCRMSPIQKAEVVDLIKASPERPVTAAIGDGANDVSMIQEADVGIGIMGKEGRQAVCNSDYAFGKFRFLRRALLMHGHLYYHRLATLVKYFFYKNVAWITCQLYYAIYNYWSQQSLYETFHLTFYNMTSTSLPILIYGIFEQCQPLDRLINEPRLYRTISKNASLSWKVFLEWMLLAVYHSLVFFYLMYFMERGSVTHFKSGYSIGNYDFGTAIAFAGIVAVNVKLMIETYFWCWPLVASYAFAFCGNFILIVLYSNIFWPSWIMTTRDLYGVPFQLYQSASVWLCCLLTVVTALLPDVVIRAIRDTASTYEAKKVEAQRQKAGQSEQSSRAEAPGTSRVDASGGNPRSQDSPQEARASHSMQSAVRRQSSNISLASGEAEMTRQPNGRGRPATAAESIELQDTNRNQSYGSTEGGTEHGFYDNPALSVSDNDLNFASVPVEAVIIPGQGRISHISPSHHHQEQEDATDAGISGRYKRMGSYVDRQFNQHSVDMDAPVHIIKAGTAGNDVILTPTPPMSLATTTRPIFKLTNTFSWKETSGPGQKVNTFDHSLDNDDTVDGSQTSRHRPISDLGVVPPAGTSSPSSTQFSNTVPPTGLEPTPSEHTTSPSSQTTHNPKQKHRQEELPVLQPPNSHQSPTMSAMLSPTSSLPVTSSSPSTSGSQTANISTVTSGNVSLLTTQGPNTELEGHVNPAFSLKSQDPNDKGGKNLTGTIFVARI